MKKIYLEKTITDKLKKQCSIKKSIEFLLAERPISYSDVSCTHVQCAKSKSRSFIEFFYILKTIHPRVTWERFGKLLRENMLTNKKHILIFCRDIEKITISTCFAGNVSYKQAEKLLIVDILYDYAILVYKNFYDKPKDTPSIEEILQFMGYNSSVIGKAKKKAYKLTIK